VTGPGALGQIVLERIRIGRGAGHVAAAVVVRVETRAQQPCGGRSLTEVRGRERRGMAHPVAVAAVDVPGVDHWEVADEGARLGPVAQVGGGVELGLLDRRRSGLG